MCSAIAIDAVAAGDGAFRTDVTSPIRWMHRIRAEIGLTVDPRRQVHAEERVLRVGHRIDEVPYPVPGVRAQPQVLAAKRDDLRRCLVPGRRGEQVGLQPGADDQPGQPVGSARSKDT
jgi:hypothetical protein